MQLKSYIKGDSQVWSIIGLLAIVSLVIVYSASSNLAYINSTGNTFKWLTKQSVHLILGLSFTVGISKLNHKYFAPVAAMALPFVIVLLAYTSLQGLISSNPGATNTARWISIPFIGVSFQTSSLASLALITYLARYLSKNDVSKISF
ncbi:MAG: FtsW/RodA/SpoVE family cell cycle protein, partial [Schleiferiaceae bacterium]|nr:FtsW/RodA/SpoVE family cell cycle protein [Schleiferiaceae bacterium]